MRSRLCIFFVILALLPVSVAFAEEKDLTGEVSVTGVLPYISGNKANFNRYRDYKDGAIRPFGGVFLDYDNKKGYFFDFNASDIGYDTQEYMLEGGKYGSFKYNLYYNELIHNTTWNARTYYTGAGSDTLNYAGAAQPPSDPNLWNTFDYSLKRKRFGAGVDLSVAKPFFFSFDVGREKKEGIKHKLGASEGGEEAIATFGLTTELPDPIDYRTDHLKAEIGYGKQPFFATLSYYYQKFENDNSFLTARNPFFNNNPFNTTPGIDTIPLFPDNDYQKVSFAGNMKLPWNSKFNAKLAWSRATSDKNLLTSFFGNPPTAGTPAVVTGPTPLVPITLSDTRFDGKVETQNYHFVLNSAPFSFLDGKVFYQYNKKDNKLDQITQQYTDPTTGLPVEFENELFEYTKKNYGAELDFKVMKGLHLIGGYTHYDVDRERVDIPKNKDDIYSAQVRYTGLPIATITAGYEYLVRAADHRVLSDSIEASIIEQYVRRFDLAAKNQDTWKVDLQLYPLDNLNFNFMYKYIKADYKDTSLGVTKDERNFWGVGADYAWKKWFKVSGYFDWEEVKWTQFQRRYNPASAPPSNILPFSGTQNSTNYNWTLDQKDKNYDWGVAADVYPMPKKLTVRMGYDNVRSNGNADFTYLTSAALTASGGVTRTQDNIDIQNWDDYRKQSLFIKFIYNATPKLTLTTGYAYESYRYTDAQYDGYQNTIPIGATGTSINTYLTGAYANPNYKANIVFLGAAYKF